MAINGMSCATGSASKHSHQKGPCAFNFLIHLDSVTGRKVGNAGNFAVSDPTDQSDNELSEMLVPEYPVWIKAATAAGPFNANRGER